jgi:hypothetical protein
VGVGVAVAYCASNDILGILVKTGVRAVVLPLAGVAVLGIGGTG